MQRRQPTSARCRSGVAQAIQHGPQRAERSATRLGHAPSGRQAVGDGRHVGIGRPLGKLRERSRAADRGRSYAQAQPRVHERPGQELPNAAQGFRQRDAGLDVQV